MTINNTVTEFPRAKNLSKSVTLDDVIQSMIHWRSQKAKPQEQIPDQIWQDIFVLLEKFSETTIRTALGISAAQFRRKMDERQEISPSKAQIQQPTEPSRIDFCPAKPDISLHKPAKIPATNTLVVEFCRADGQIMKIHTTTDSFSDLMKAFFTGV